jgi:AraC family transcriptional regulator of adaptative response/methylated-DNA-[protein]-cysteine methyltransferase
MSSTSFSGIVTAAGSLTKAEMEAAWTRRDAGYDGLFYVGVRTTGVFCRPSCPAKPPRPENCRYFVTAKDALFDGFRACRRCRPLEASSDSPAWARALIERVDAGEARIPGRELRRLGVDPGRARRWFQARYGMSFAAYCRARRLSGALGALRAGASVDDAQSAGGFESASGFRAAFARSFGSAPGAARAGDVIVTALFDSPIGALVAGATRGGICLLEFADRRMLEAQLAVVGRRLGMPVAPGKSALLEKLRRELERYFAGELREFSVPLVAPGTPFEERVWAALRRIPYGATISYAALARSVGSPGASRAVGSANGRNRIAIVIPCHRVINAGGALGGYGGGLERKRRLLALERRVLGRATELFE